MQGAGEITKKVTGQGDSALPHPDPSGAGHDDPFAGARQLTPSDGGGGQVTGNAADLSGARHDPSGARQAGQGKQADEFLPYKPAQIAKGENPSFAESLDPDSNGVLTRSEYERSSWKLPDYGASDGFSLFQKKNGKGFRFFRQAAADELRGETKWKRGFGLEHVAEPESSGKGSAEREAAYRIAQGLVRKAGEIEDYDVSRQLLGQAGLLFARHGFKGEMSRCNRLQVKRAEEAGRKEDAAFSRALEAMSRRDVAKVEEQLGIVPVDYEGREILTEFLDSYRRFERMVQTLRVAESLAGVDIALLEQTEKSWLGRATFRDFTADKEALRAAVGAWAERLRSGRFQNTRAILEDLWAKDAAAKKGLEILNTHAGNHLTLEEIVGEEERPDAKAFKDRLGRICGNGGAEGKSQVAAVAKVFAELPSHKEAMSALWEEEGFDRPEAFSLQGFTEPQNILVILGSFGLARLTTAAIMARVAPAGVEGLALGSRVAVTAGEVAIESGGFTLYSRLLGQILTTAGADWSAGAVAKDWAVLALSFGFLRAAMSPLRALRQGLGRTKSFGRPELSPAVVDGVAMPALSRGGEILFRGVKHLTETGAFYLGAQAGYLLDLSCCPPHLFDQWLNLVAFQAAVRLANGATGGWLNRQAFQIRNRPIIEAAQRVGEAIVGEGEGAEMIAQQVFLAHLKGDVSGRGLLDLAREAGKGEGGEGGAVARANELFARAKVPLVYDGETLRPKWRAVDRLATVEGAKEIAREVFGFGAGGELTPEGLRKAYKKYAQLHHEDRVGVARGGALSVGDVKALGKMLAEHLDGKKLSAQDWAELKRVCGSLRGAIAAGEKAAPAGKGADVRAPAEARGVARGPARSLAATSTFDFTADAEPAIVAARPLRSAERAESAERKAASAARQGAAAASSPTLVPEATRPASAGSGAELAIGAAPAATTAAPSPVGRAAERMMGGASALMGAPAPMMGLGWVLWLERFFGGGEKMEAPASPLPPVSQSVVPATLPPSAGSTPSAPATPDNASHNLGGELLRIVVGYSGQPLNPAMSGDLLTRLLSESPSSLLPMTARFYDGLLRAVSAERGLSEPPVVVVEGPWLGLGEGALPLASKVRPRVIVVTPPGNEGSSFSFWKDEAPEFLRHLRISGKPEIFTPEADVKGDIVVWIHPLLARGSFGTIANDLGDALGRHLREGGYLVVQADLDEVGYALARMKGYDLLLKVPCSREGRYLFPSRFFAEGETDLWVLRKRAVADPPSCEESSVPPGAVPPLSAPAGCAPPKLAGGTPPASPPPTAPRDSAPPSVPVGSAPPRSALPSLASVPAAGTPSLRPGTDRKPGARARGRERKRVGGGGRKGAGAPTAQRRHEDETGSMHRPEKPPANPSEKSGNDIPPRIIAATLYEGDKLSMLDEGKRFSAIAYGCEKVASSIARGEIIPSQEERRFLLQFTRWFFAKDPAANYYISYKIFRALQDFDGMYRCVRATSTPANDRMSWYAKLEEFEEAARLSDLEEDERGPDIFTSPRLFENADLSREFAGRIHGFMERRGHADRPFYHIQRAASDLAQLAGDYDVVISIAGGGLYSGGVAEILGMKVRVIEVHAHKRRHPTSRAIDEIEPSDIAGKRVLLADQDVITGASVKETARFLSRFAPAKIGVYLNIPPSARTGSYNIGSIPSAIAELENMGIAVHHPRNIAPMPAIEVFNGLHERLGTSLGRLRKAGRSLDDILQKREGTHPAAVGKIREYLNRLRETYFALNPFLPGVEEAREGIVHSMERLLKDHETAVQLASVLPGAPDPIVRLANIAGSSTPMPTGIAETMLRKRYIAQGEKLMAERHIKGELRIPVSYTSSFSVATRAARGHYDYALIVGPEGFAYEPIFRDLGIPTVAINIPEEDYGGHRTLRTFAPDDLTALRGKRVLVVEDDVHSGATLKKILDSLQSHRPAHLGLYLGNPRFMQQLRNVPADFEDIYVAKDDEDFGGSVYPKFLNERYPLFKHKLPFSPFKPIDTPTAPPSPSAPAGSAPPSAPPARTENFPAPLQRLDPHIVEASEPAPPAGNGPSPPAPSSVSTPAVHTIPDPLLDVPIGEVAAMSERQLADFAVQLFQRCQRKTMRMAARVVEIVDELDLADASGDAERHQDLVEELGIYAADYGRYGRRWKEIEGVFPVDSYPWRIVNDLRESLEQALQSAVGEIYLLSRPPAPGKPMSRPSPIGQHVREAFERLRHRTAVPLEGGLGEVETLVTGRELAWRFVRTLQSVAAGAERTEKGLRFSIPLSSPRPAASEDGSGLSFSRIFGAIGWPPRAGEPALEAVAQLLGWGLTIAPDGEGNVVVEIFFDDPRGEGTSPPAGTASPPQGAPPAVPQGSSPSPSSSPGSAPPTPSAPPQPATPPPSSQAR